MRSALMAVLLVAGASSAFALDKANVCPEGDATLTGTIGENKLFEPPEYWIGDSAPCKVHVIELEKANDACAKGAKFSVKGKVEHVREDGELSLVHIVKPEKMECGK